MPSWNWDEAADSEGVVHQSVANTDNDDATTLKQGYDLAGFSEITPSPSHCWPMHEVSGTTMNDIAGTDDGTYVGMGPAGSGTASGPLGTTMAVCDGADDYASYPSQGATYDGTNSYSISAWVYINGSPSGGDRAMVWTPREDYDVWITLADGAITPSGSDEIAVGFFDGSVNEIYQSGTPSGEHIFVTMAWDPSGDQSLFIDGSAVVTQATANPNSTANTNSWGGDPSQSGTNTFFPGRISFGMEHGTNLSLSQHQALHNVVDTPGDWLGAGKVI